MILPKWQKWTAAVIFVGQSLKLVLRSFIRGLPRLLLRYGVIAYLAGLVLVPLGWVVYQTFHPGLADAWQSATHPLALHALRLTLELALIAVVVNTVFGVLAALMIVRYPFPGSNVLGAITDLPLGLSPVVVGVSLILVYGETGWFGSWLQRHGITVIFSFPGMVLATTFVTLPFVVREVIPVIREVGTDQEQAAATLGASAITTFFKITLPSIRAGVVYGVVLTMARALGEFGAVSVVAGDIIGVTQTTTMWVNDQYTGYMTTDAYVGSLELAILAIATLVIMNLIRSRKSTAGS